MRHLSRWPRLHANARARAAPAALMSAASKGHADVVQALLDARADPHARSRDGKTALDYATDARVQAILEAAAAARAPPSAAAGAGAADKLVVRLNKRTAGDIAAATGAAVAAAAPATAASVPEPARGGSADTGGSAADAPVEAGASTEASAAKKARVGAE